jgi:hypothetical protein
MDDFSAARMILSGIPLDESFLQHRLSILMKEEQRSLGGGKLPVPECYYLMGTADPTGILESDEVCVILYVYCLTFFYISIWLKPFEHLRKKEKATIQELDNKYFEIYIPTAIFY